jgi:hypothetical protein
LLERPFRFWRRWCFFSDAASCRFTPTSTKRCREKQEPVKRVATDLPRHFHLSDGSSVRRTPTTVDATAYRSFISLGAVRCDQDVGLHLLVRTLLI